MCSYIATGGKIRPSWPKVSFQKSYQVQFLSWTHLNIDKRKVCFCWINLLSRTKKDFSFLSALLTQTKMNFTPSTIQNRAKKKLSFSFYLTPLDFPFWGGGGVMNSSLEVATIAASNAKHARRAFVLARFSFYCYDVLRLLKRWQQFFSLWALSSAWSCDLVRFRKHNDTY